MNRFGLVLILIILFACKAPDQVITSSTFKSTCGLYHRLPRVTLILTNDRMFTYKFPYSEDVQGTWEVSKDSLVLKSGDFPTTIEPNTPIRKYTDFDGRDVYLIRGKMLFALSQDRGVINDCYLLRDKKDQRYF